MSGIGNRGDICHFPPSIAQHSLPFSMKDSSLLCGITPLLLSAHVLGWNWTLARTGTQDLDWSVTESIACSPPDGLGTWRQQLPNLAETQNTQGPLPRYTEPADLGLVWTIYVFNKFPRECGWLGLGITAPLCLYTLGALEPLVPWKGWESIFRLWSYQLALSCPWK